MCGVRLLLLVLVHLLDVLLPAVSCAPRAAPSSTPGPPGLLSTMKRTPITPADFPDEELVSVREPSESAHQIQLKYALRKVCIAEN